MEIRRLDEHDEAAFRAFALDFAQDSDNPHSNNMMTRLQHWAVPFAQALSLLRKSETDPQPGRVPQTDFFCFDDEGAIAGVASCRWRLVSALLVNGGHIGYFVAPSFRCRGYATALLRFGSGFLRDLGVQKILVTAYEGNGVSRRAIERCRGVMENTILEEGASEPLCRYWIGS